jgi:hypothetical protein
MLDTNDRENRLQTNIELSKLLLPMNGPSGNAIGFFEQRSATSGAVGLACIITAVTIMMRYG